MSTVIDPKAPVTFDLLQAFSEKCEKTFDKSPSFINDTNPWLKVLTPFHWGLNDCFDSVYFHLLGKAINNAIISSDFYFATGGNYAVNAGRGTNSGDAQVEAVLVGYNSTDSAVWFYFTLENQIDFLECQVYATFIKNDEKVAKVELTVSVEEAEPESWQYEITTQNGIVSQSFDAPQFRVDQGTAVQERYKQYTQGATFDKINLAEIAKVLSPRGTVSFSYDYETTLSEGDEEAISFNIEGGGDFSLPVPEIHLEETLPNVDVTKDYNLVKIDKTGRITDYDYQEPELATDEIPGVVQVAGIQLDTEDKLYLRLDSGTSVPYVRTPSITGAYVPTTYSFANMTPEDYAGLIYQYNGPTTEAFVNGYFYKSSQETPADITVTKSSKLYNRGNDSASKFRTFLSSHSEFSNTVNFVLEVTYFPEIYQDDVNVAKLSDINDFLLYDSTNLSIYIDLNAQLITDILDLTFSDYSKTHTYEDLEGEGDAEKLSKFTFQYNASGYSWQQINVLPIPASSSESWGVTESDIDRIFYIKAASISINEGAELLEVEKNGTGTLSYVISPEDSDYQDVVITTDYEYVTFTLKPNKDYTVSFLERAEIDDEFEVTVSVNELPNVNSSINIKVIADEEV